MIGVGALGVCVVAGGIWWAVGRTGRTGAAVAVDAGGAGVALVTEREPNDTSETAQALSGGSVEVAANWESGSIDIYRLAIEGSGGWIIDAAIEDHDGLDLRVQRLGEPGTSVTSPSQIGALGAAQGTYLVTVSAGGAAGAGPYTLRLATTRSAPGVEWEPNDDAEHAAKLAAGKPDVGEISRLWSAGWLSRPGDVDCFVAPLQVPQNGAVVRFELTPPPSVRARLVVLANDATRLAARVAGRAGETVIVPALGGRSWERSYFACVAAEEGTGFAEKYRLDVRSWSPPGPFEFEPNDTFETASALPRGITLGGFLSGGDMDVYRISAGPQRTVGVRVAAPFGVAPRVAVLDRDRRILRQAEAPSGGTVSIEEAGAVFVQVWADGQDDLETYTVSTYTEVSGVKLQ